MTGARFDDADALVLGAVGRGEIPGAVLHVRAHGRVLHERAFGRRRADTDGAPALDGLFSVASLTKLVVAAAVLRLSDEGRLSLDEAIAPISRSSPGTTTDSRWPRRSRASARCRWRTIRARRGRTGSARTSPGA